jgi:hypothetical protein
MGMSDRVCVTKKEWEKMSLEEKVEVLGVWSVEMTRWAEQVSEKLKSNGGGGPIPPKHPKDPYC